LITRLEIDGVRGLAFVDGANVDGNRLQVPIRLLAQHVNFALVAGLQNAARFGNSFGHGQSSRHQANTGLRDVANYAVTIRTGAIKRHRDLRFNDVFVVTLLDQFRDLVDGLAVDEDAFRNQRE